MATDRQRRSTRALSLGVVKYRTIIRNQLVLPMIASALCFAEARADDQFFGFTRGAETLPQCCSEIYQFVTMRAGKAEGRYYGFDFETEFEHGFSDRFQASISIEHHYFNNKGVDGDRDALDDVNAWRWGGLASSAKYNLLSPFKDP